MAKSHQELIINVSLDVPKMSCLKAGLKQVRLESYLSPEGRTCSTYIDRTKYVLFLFRRDRATIGTSRTYLRVIEPIGNLTHVQRVTSLMRCYPPANHYKTFHKTLQFFLSSLKKKQKTVCDNTKYDMGNDKELSNNPSIPDIQEMLKQS